jgi:hypothetical protein
MERPGISEVLETMASVAARLGDPRTGAQLVGAAGVLRASGGSQRQPDEEDWVADVVGGLRATLGADAYAAAEAEGAELDLADALDRALAMAVSVTPSD